MSQQKNNHFSRKIIAVLEIIATFARDYQINPIGEVLEWLKRHAWKACSRQNRLAGSNPVLSAIKTLSKEDLADARHSGEHLVVYTPYIPSTIMESQRILLRPWRESDAGALFRYASDPEVGPRAGWAPHQSEAESLGIIRTVFNNIAVR